MIDSKTIPVVLNGQTYQISAKVRGPFDKLAVFIHGWGCVKEGFDGAFEAEALQEYGLCTFDLLGYGQSDKPAGFGYALEDQADIAVSVIRSLLPKSVVLVGHSMGGLVAVLAAQKLGDSLDCLISAEGNLISRDVGEKGSSTRRLAAQSYADFEASGFAKFKDGLARSQDEGMRVWSTWCGQASPEAFQKSGQSLVEWSDSGRLLPMFRSIRRRVYMVGDGSQGKAETVAALEAGEVITVPHSKHFFMIDNPDWFYGVIAAFVKK